MSEYLKCRFCDFKTPKFRKLKDGRFRSGWNILNGHIEVDHPEKWEELLKWWEGYRKDCEEYYSDTYDEEEEFICRT